MPSSAAGRTRRRPGSKHMSIRAFRHITKSSTVAGRTCCGLDVGLSKRTYGHVLVLPSRRLVRPAADDGFVICHQLYYKKTPT